MAVVYVEEGGTTPHFATLKGAIDANETDIQIIGEWNASEDLTSAMGISNTSTKVEAIGDSKTGAVVGTAANGGSKPFQLRETSGTPNSAIIIYSDGDLEIIGVDMCNESTGTSDEVIRIDADNVDLKCDSCLMWFTSSVDQQDLVYVNDKDGCTVELVNCIGWNAGRAVVDLYASTDNDKGTDIDINSCSFYEIGGHNGLRSGIIGGFNIDGTWNIFNSLLHVTGQYSAEHSVVYANLGTQTASVDRCITRMGDINNLDNNTDNLVSKTWVTGDPDTDEVGVISLTTPDFSLYDDEDNIAQDAHSDSSGAGLTMPTLDIRGVRRGTKDFCVGAFNFKGKQPNAKFSLGQIEHKPNIVLHDFPYQTGSTDYLIGHWKCDDNAASSTVVATTGTNAALSVGNTSSYTYSGENRLGLDLQKTTATSLIISDSDHLHAYALKGGISFEFKPQFAEAVSADQNIMRLRVDDYNITDFKYESFYDRFDLRMYWGDDSYVGTGLVVTTDTELQQWWQILIGWDVANGTAFMQVGTDFYSFKHDSSTAFTSTSVPTIEFSYDEVVDMSIRNIKTFNESILPYGAYFVGNSGADQLAYAHKDISYFNSDGTSLEIGVTSYSTVAGNIDADEGSMSLWFDPDDYSSDTDLFGAAATLMIEWDDSDNDILFTYGSASIRTTSILSGGDNHIKVTWEASGEITLERNGVAETAVAASTAPSLGASFTIDTNITDIYITSDKNTPQIPCTGKIALDVPIVRND